MLGACEEWQLYPADGSSFPENAFLQGIAHEFASGTIDFWAVVEDKRADQSRASFA